MSAAQLLATLATTPNLPGAACVAERETFDACLEPWASTRICAAAIRVCATCPALGPCAAWVHSLPIRKRPLGVTAGLIRRSR